jgi:hypothetical protein
VSAPAIVWTITGIVLVVLLILAALQVVRTIREAKRLIGRVRRYRDLPILGAARQAQIDVGRLQAAAEQARILWIRAKTALATIRRGIAVLRALVGSP